jgi:hypothetical protein
MTDLETTEKQISNSGQWPANPVAVSADEVRQDPAGWRTLYVLCLSLAGAIMGDVLLLIYFTSIHSYG